jgi:hypothetical protein
MLIQVRFGLAKGAAYIAGRLTKISIKKHPTDNAR